MTEKRSQEPRTKSQEAIAEIVLEFDYRFLALGIWFLEFGFWFFSLSWVISSLRLPFRSWPARLADRYRAVDVAASCPGKRRPARRLRPHDSPASISHC